MTANTNDRATKYEAAARAALAEGFANETRRKEDGLERVSRAYEQWKELVQIEIRNTVKLHDRKWELEFPYDLHNLRPKHSAYVLELVPTMADTVKRIEALLVLRNEIKAATLLPRKTPKREQVPQEGDKTQQRGHCQCCGREHAVRGDVAKHGYDVKHGFFNGICPGHRYAPMEICRKQTDATVKSMREEATFSDAESAKVKDGKITPRMICASHRDETLVPFADAPEVWQRRAVAALAHQLESRAHSLRAMAKSLAAMADLYHGRPLLIVKL